MLNFPDIAAGDPSQPVTRQWLQINDAREATRGLRSGRVTDSSILAGVHRQIMTGVMWQTPCELDPTCDICPNRLVYLSPQNPLVTTGLIDLVSATLTLSPAGIWLSRQYVPAQNEAGKYNVPQLPYPGATGIPAGSPLTGDLDGPDVYWVLIAQVPMCF